MYTLFLFPGLLSGLERRVVWGAWSLTILLLIFLLLYRVVVDDGDDKFFSSAVLCPLVLTSDSGFFLGCEIVDDVECSSNLLG